MVRASVFIGFYINFNAGEPIRMPVSLSFPSIWVPGSSFILASCLIGKEAISSILLDQWHRYVMTPYLTT